MNEAGGGGASRSTEPASGTSSATDVSLREFLGVQVSYESKITRLLVGVLGGFGAFSWSLIQWRLANLNHENARILDQQAKTVSADTYSANESQRKDELEKLDTWQERVDEQLTKAVTRDEVKEATREDARVVRRDKVSTSTAVILAFAAAISAVLLLLTYQHNRAHTPTVTVTVPTQTTGGAP